MNGAVLSYAGNTTAVTIAFAAGQELVSGAALTVTVSGVSDLFGNAMASAVTIGGSTSGDASDPAFDQAFVNYRADAAGAVIDVQFSEDVDTSFVSSTSNWTATGSTVSSIEVLERNHCRVTLSAALGASGTLGLTGLPDLAGNTSGAITIDPNE